MTFKQIAYIGHKDNTFKMLESSSTDFQAKLLYYLPNEVGRASFQKIDALIISITLLEELQLTIEQLLLKSDLENKPFLVVIQDEIPLDVPNMLRYHLLVDICYDQAKSYEIFYRLDRLFQFQKNLTFAEEETDYFKKAINSLNAILIVLNKDYEILTFNPRAESILGYHHKKVYKKNFFDVLFGISDEKYEIRKAFELYIDNYKEFFDLEIPILGSENRKEVLIRFSISAVYIQTKDKQLSLDKLILVGHDITERLDMESKIQSLAADLKLKNIKLEQYNDELIQLNKLKNNFLHLVSHDLNSPLTAILGYLQMAKKHVTNEKAFGILEKIDSSAKKQLELVGNLLEIARIESGTAKLNWSKASIKDIIQSSVDMLGSLADQKGIRLEVSLDSQIPESLIDSSKLSQVISNLIGNAIKFTKQDGQVRVNAKKIENQLYVGVIDTGIGIPEEKQHEIFENFVQINRYGTAGERGTGLGLAISKNFVELHGGTIGVISEEGKGSTFYFNIPIYEKLELVPNH